MSENLTQEEKISRLRLARSENVGPVTFFHLLDMFGSAKEALLHISDFAKRGGLRRSIIIASEDDIDREMEGLEKIGAVLLCYGDEDYPKLLEGVEDAPPVLSVLGRRSLLEKDSVGIVGSRNASLNGKNLTRQIAYALSEKNYVVTSGMALGIDAAAHQGALASDKGGTIAVLGTGLDVIYPKENENLYHQILSSSGVIVSELPLGTQPFPRNFPKRNRIISGLSKGVLVVESHEKSGSLITADYAKSQKREVFAIPGSPLDVRSAGTNNLIQSGKAHLVQKAEDIISTLMTLNLTDVSDVRQTKLWTTPFRMEDDVLDEACDIIVSNLSYSPVSVDSLVAETGISLSMVQAVLVGLELAGRLERHAGNRVSMIANMEGMNDEVSDS